MSTDLDEQRRVAADARFAARRAGARTPRALAAAVRVLRAVAAELPDAPRDIDCLREVLELTAQGLDAATCADRTGLSEAEVCAIVADFGSFAALVFKLKIQPERPASSGLLFPIHPDRSTLAAMRPAKRRRLGYDADASVIVPAAYHRVQDGRTMDLRRACAVTAAAIRQGHVDDAALLRFHARRYPPHINTLTLPDVAVTWRLCVLGRFPDVASDDATTAHFARTLLAGYGLLESARRNAVAAAADLSLRGLDRAGVEAACRAAGPLYEAAVARLEQRLAAASDTRRVRLALDDFARTVAADPAPAGVADLSEGQMLRIAQSAGLTNPSATRDVRAMRAGIESAGLGTDADQLIPLGMAAEAAGLAEAFWEAVAARAAGDRNWDAALRDPA